MSGPVLPASVILPTCAEIDHRALTKALNASRQRLYLWRQHHGFPQSVGSGSTTITETSAVAAWLNARGVNVTWV